MSHPTETELSVDVIVVGGGMSGASVAYEIAEHRTVALLERESTLAFHTTGGRPQPLSRTTEIRSSGC